ncbi:MAG: DinB family protein, partial [Flavobacteriales bacterium]|nr:DinB family protein [Flavobacteriales bacterium]
MGKKDKLIAQMVEERSELLKKLEALSNEEFVAIPEQGGWSISQVINHLMISEFGSSRYISKKLLGLEDLRPTGLKNNVNSKALKFALRSGKKFKAPKVLPEPENQAKEITLEKWEKIR